MKKLNLSLLAAVTVLSACSAIEAPAPPAPPPTPPAPPTSPSPPTSAPASSVATVTKINAQQAKELMDQTTGYVILDVRTLAEYKEAHIAGAVLIPVDQIDQLAPDKLPDLAQQIFVYCRSGGRSAQAAKALVKLGYTNIYDFGGITSWPYGTVTD